MSTRGPFPHVHLYRQRGQMTAWIRSRLWAQVIAALLLGLGVGAALGPDGGVLSAQDAQQLGAWFALPGQIFFGLIAMVLVPLIFASIIGGLTGSGSSDALQRIGLRFAAFVIVTTLAAAGIGIALALWLRPGSGFPDAAQSQPVAPPDRRTRCARH